MHLYQRGPSLHKLLIKFAHVYNFLTSHRLNVCHLRERVFCAMEGSATNQGKGVACVKAAGIYTVSGTLDIWLSYQVPIGPKTSYSYLTPFLDNALCTV